ncbi:hypothetical protein ACFPN2_26100 [Steroidobacter flavus]|uniref:Outer membrane protein beta-barrel domain-containing protein n=1 Tax=Steroidobacter flavus TaxID=1842136 RepID=A0ABV8SY66_9GAMM
MALARFLPPLVFIAAMGISGKAHADRVSVWGGGGVGTMLTGEGAVYVNGHKMGALSVALPGNKFRVRYLKGSFERTQGIDSNTGDNDLDYEGFDFVVTRAATDFPVDLAIGASRYEEAYHLGYPDQDLGGSEFVHRWGPHVSALRSWPLGRFAEAWAEMDLHFAPYQPQQTFLLVDVGLGVRF